MGNQGRSLSERQVNRIIDLLASTEMTMPQIAIRMGCSRSAVTSVNTRFGVRNYQGSRAKWKLGTTEKDETPTHIH